MFNLRNQKLPLIECDSANRYHTDAGWQGDATFVIIAGLNINLIAGGGGRNGGVDGGVHFLVLKFESYLKANYSN